MPQSSIKIDPIFSFPPNPSNAALTWISISNYPVKYLSLLIHSISLKAYSIKRINQAFSFIITPTISPSLSLSLHAQLERLQE